MKSNHNKLYLLLECWPGDARVYNETVDDLTVVGIPQVCQYNGVWAALCNDGTNTNNSPEILCQLLGYDGQW